MLWTRVFCNTLALSKKSKEKADVRIDNIGITFSRSKESVMKPVFFRYRSRDLGPQDICFIQNTVAQSYGKGPTHKKRNKLPGRGEGHPEVARQRPTRIDPYQEHTLNRCSDCQTPPKGSVDTYQRYIEDLPPVQPVVTDRTVHR
jgi:hypothetical protein